VSRYYCADGNALVADLEALYGPKAPVGDFKFLAGPNPWARFDPGFYPYPRIEDGPEPARPWPMPEQARLFDVE